MTNIPIKIQFVKSLSTAQPSRIVAVKADSDTAFSLFVTDKTGISYPLKDLQNNVIITNTDGNLQITSSSTSTNINLASSILATINSALQRGDNISELVNNVGYLTTFTETDPVFQASEASLFVSGDKFNLDNQSGINSGDQDSIVGISGTKAQFNTELTDGDFLFVGDVLDTPDATVTTKGILKLTGDLGGMADNPTTPTAIHKIGDEIKHGILTLSDGLKIVGNTTSTTATKVNVQENDGTINTKPLSELANYVEFASAVNLPVTGVAGKIYVTKDNGKIYRWNDTYYTELAITDISGKVDKIVGKSLLSDTEITRLATLSNYTHPTNHPPSIITQDANNRFVTDVEKATWNNKQATITTDSSLYLDPTTKELRLNIGESNQYFNYVSGVKEFTLVNEPASITYISINGVLLSNPFADYTINAALKKITINADVQPNSDINVNYKFIITQ